MTENAEDCKRYFFTLKLTKNDNCKRYDEYKYDQKRTVNIFVYITIKGEIMFTI